MGRKRKAFQTDALRVLETFVSRPFVDLGSEARIDAMMDARDQPRFEAEWLRVYEEVQSADAPDVGTIPRDAFLRAFEANEHHDLAAQVSDDLELLAEALLAGVEDPWLNALWASYAAGKFPHRTLRPLRGSLADVIVEKAKEKKRPGRTTSRARTSGAKKRTKKKARR